MMSSLRFTRYESILGGSAKLSVMTGRFSKQLGRPRSQSVRIEADERARSLTLSRQRATLAISSYGYRDPILMTGPHRLWEPDV